MGFKRSAEKCKERFEEESRYFNDNINFSKNCRLFSELEEQFYNANDNSHVGAEKNRKMLMEKSPNEHERLEEDEEEEEEEEDKEGRESTNLEVLEDLRHDKVSDGKEVVEEVKMVEVSRSKKRKKKSLEMLMGFCEGVVKKMMEQQEEMHSKLLEDMVRRDEEKLAEEEAWRKQEVDRMNQELDIMANEQEIEGNRQAKIIEFFKQFASIPLETHEFFRGRNEKDPQKVIPENSKTFVQAQNPNPTCRDDDPIVTKTLDRQKPNSTKVAISSNQQNPNHSPKTKKNQSNPSQISTKKIPQSTNSNHEKAELLDSIGKRWPRDEVLALINLRCNTSNINNGTEEKEGLKAPLWERISQGMLELGYERSAKRCKEKWENINKYFRKTKDASKKRSFDSRTCPYFHQLSTLYNQAKVVDEPELRHESSPALPETISTSNS